MIRIERLLPAFLIGMSLVYVGVSESRADYLAAEAALHANNFGAAVPLLQEEANLGNPVAAYNLGKIYATGALGAPDYVSAATWFRQAAEVGSVPARFDGQQLGPQAADLIFAAQLYSQFELAKLYEEGKGVPADITQAVRWYQRAADQDFDLAQLQLVRLYSEGRGAELPADPAAATKWLTRLAEHGNVAAMNELGRAYLQGRGVLKNAKTAHDWFDKASSLGSPEAAFNMGILYQAGYLGQPDYLRAAEFYNLGANRKDAQSMAALGDLYFAGRGVPQSNVQAHVWYDLAARYGLPMAGERRDKVAKSLTEAEVSTARQMADQWRPQGDFGIPLPAGLSPEATPSAEAPMPELVPTPPEVAPVPMDATGEPVPQPMVPQTEPQPDVAMPAPATMEPEPAPSTDATFIDPLAPGQEVPPPASMTEPATTPSTELPATPTEPGAPLVGTPQPGSTPFEPPATN